MNDLHDSHSLHASKSAERFWQFIVLAKILAQVVLPTPRGPQKRYEWANFPLEIAPFRVLTRDSCPTTEEKVDGLYFLAETIKFSMLQLFTTKVCFSRQFFVLINKELVENEMRKYCFEK